MKYTKKQRHEIYKKVIKQKDLHRGTCTKIVDIIEKDCYSHFYDTVKAQFKELMMFAPYEDCGCYRHWFDDEMVTGYSERNRDHRETILEFCIEITK